VGISAVKVERKSRFANGWWERGAPNRKGRQRNRFPEEPRQGNDCQRNEFYSPDNHSPDSPSVKEADEWRVFLVFENLALFTYINFSPQISAVFQLNFPPPQLFPPKRLP
jgi:hypothetical protein